MINFFRRIRHKLINELKLGRYMLYAFGEILLIVLGILIALQINNWNERNKTLVKEESLLLTLDRDFSSNMEHIDVGLKEFNIDLSFQNAVMRHTGPNVQIPPPGVFDSISNINYTIVEVIYGSINHSFNQNRLEILQSENLRSKIVDFMVALVKYKEGENVSKELALELRRIHQKYTCFFDLRKITFI